jgi:hypothetical protein
LALFFIINSVTVLAAENLTFFPLKSIVDVEQIRNDLLQITAEVDYPNGCYKPESFLSEIDDSKSTIYLSHIVSKQNNLCIQKVMHTLPTFVINGTLDGTYRIVDKSNDRLIGEVEINGP